MRFSLLLLAAAVVAPATSAQTLLSESFETDGNGSRYFAVNEYRNNGASYFLRTDGSNINSQDAPYSGFDGSFFFAGRNVDSNGPSTKTLTFDPVNTGGATSLTLSALIGSDKEDIYDNDGANNDFIYFEYSIDGSGVFVPCVYFESDAPAGTIQGQMRVDNNLDGFGDGAELVPALASFNCSIPDGATTVTPRFRINLSDVNESVAIDLVQLQGPPPGISGSIEGGTCGPIPFNRPSETSRCFPQISGTNNLPNEQRYTLYFVIEGTAGPATGFTRVAKRGEVKPGAFESLSNKFSLRTFDTDPDGTYDLVLVADFGSTSSPSGSAVELDRVVFTKGGGGSLRATEALSAYPNPATDAATIRFAVTEATAATVVIYDALGREVARPVDGVVSGTVEAQLDAASLSAGLYVARLLVDGRTETVRFSVVR